LPLAKLRRFAFPSILTFIKESQYLLISLGHSISVVIAWSGGGKEFGIITNSDYNS
jgi:hypothetical protein